MAMFTADGKLIHYKGTGLMAVIDYTDENGVPVPFPAGSTAKMQIREEVEPVPTTALATLDTVAGISLHLTSGRITLAGAANLFATVDPGVYKYDLIVTPSGSMPQRIIGGEFVLEGTITQ